MPDVSKTYSLRLLFVVSKLHQPLEYILATKESGHGCTESDLDRA
jgi:hypothetical protein